MGGSLLPDPLRGIGSVVEVFYPLLPDPLRGIGSVVEVFYPLLPDPLRGIGSEVEVFYPTPCGESARMKLWLVGHCHAHDVSNLCVYGDRAVGGCGV